MLIPNGVRILVWKADSWRMCFPSPGPRCSAHAQAEYLTALSRFQGAKSLAERERLGAILETKRSVFESTPRGLNGLRREFELSKDEKLRFVLARRMEQGQATRKRQLSEYNALRREKSSVVRETLQAQGLSGRYQLAAGIAYAHVSDLGVQDVEIADLHTLTGVQEDSEQRWFVVPQKYQDLWGEISKIDGDWAGDGPLVQFLRAQHGSVEHILPQHRSLLNDWLIQHLREVGYTKLLLVDTRSEVAREAELEELFEHREVRLTLRQKLGGTTRWNGEEGELKSLLQGSVWEQGSYVKTDEGWVISGVNQQPAGQLHAGGLYLAWRGASVDYLVRRPHASTKFSPVVKLAERS